MSEEVGKHVGDYEVLAVLGTGGMGKVYKVRNVISDRVEAMKVLLPDLAGRQELASRFLREIKILAALNHPNIAALRTALTLDNQLVMIMEYVEGRTLCAWAKGDPSRHQALQYDADAPGRGEAHGLRHRPFGQRSSTYHGWHHDGVALLHVARASEGRSGRL